VGQIREAGRNTQGVKLISLREGELLQDIARVISDGDAVIEGEVDADVDADAAAEPGDAVDGDAPAGEDAAE
jgi:DNA gyrase subunit A